MLRQYAIALRSVKIVGVDDRKGLANRVGGHQNCVQRAPWLGAAGRDGKSRRKFVEFLKDVFDRDMSFKPCTDGLLELLLNLLTDNEHDLAESGPEGVVDRIVDDSFPARADWINLLEAAIAVAHTGGQNEQAWRCRRLPCLS